MLYEQIEERLTELLGCEDTLVLPTITLIHMSVIPVLAGGGTIFMENRAHKTIYEGCQFAAARGATMKKFRIDDLDGLEQLLRADRSGRRLICIDGVNSMTGNTPDLPALAAISRDATTPSCTSTTRTGSASSANARRRRADPYGMRGNSIVRHFDESYDNVVLVSGFSKSYSSLAAFIACPTELKRLLKTAASPYLYSGPSPIASLATVLAGFDVNEKRGDAIRADLWRKTAKVLDCLDRLGAHTPNRSGLPVIEVPLARHEDIDDVGRFLFDNGIYVTLAAYPLVPKSEVGFRIQTDGGQHLRGDRAAGRRARQGGRPVRPAARTRGACSVSRLAGRSRRHAVAPPAMRAAASTGARATPGSWYLGITGA